MASLMTSDYDNTDRLAIEIAECKNMGLRVLPPDVNESFHEFAVVPGKRQIRFGLDAVKNVGHGAAEEIISAREKLGGRFSNIEAYCQSVNPTIVNRKALESLIRAGAFDSFGQRHLLLGNAENILSLAQRLQKDATSGQVNLFSAGSQKEAVATSLAWNQQVPEFSPFEQLGWERELLGLYLSRHPLEDYQSDLETQTVRIADITPQMEGATVTIGGSVSAVREIVTKNGAKMAFVRIADLSGEIEAVVFPSKYQSAEELWQRDQILLARGRLGSGRGGVSGEELKLLLDEASRLTDKPAGVAKKAAEIPTSDSSHKRLYIRLRDSSDQRLLLKLKEKLDGHQGKTEVVLVTGEDEARHAIKLPQTIDVNEVSIRELAVTFGARNVVIK